MNVDWSEKLCGKSRSALRVHLIGVAGSGMSGLASLLLGLGHKVSGSDRVTTLETERLERLGLSFSSPHSADAVQGVDLVVYSSAIRGGNAAYDEANRLGIALIRRAEALAAMLNPHRGIVVAGTHGKTTTSALAAHVLRGAGLRPSHYVGAEIPILGSNALYDGEEGFFVAEGDESDGTLVLYHPEYSIILNIEPEHLDHYRGGIEEIREVFSRLANQTRAGVIYCAEDPEAKALFSQHQGAVSYGWTGDCCYSAREVEPEGTGTAFDVWQGNSHLGRVRLGIPGKHNVSNAMAVISLALEVGVNLDTLAPALESFRGAKRRFELKTRAGGVTIVDDYGHHPTEIRATIATAQTQSPGRLICLFQPHRYSRTQLLRDEFGTAFDGVDELIVTDVYPASEAPIAGISGDTIVQAVKEFGNVPVVSWHPDKQTLHLAVGNRLRPGDWVITLGAGDIHEAGTRLAGDLEVLENIRSRLAEGDGVVKLYEPMNRQTTMRIGGPAQYWVEPQTVDGLARIVLYAKEQGLPLRVIGRGSNLLVLDGGIPGLVIQPVHGEFSKLVVTGTRIEAGAGVKFKALAAAAQSAGLGGFEWMEGIPGNVGGSLRMNAGAMGADTMSQVESVQVITPEGEVLDRPVGEITTCYRSVPEFEKNIVVSAVFFGHPQDAGEIAARMEASKQKRRHSQPIAASAGCIFKNPGPCPAGALVDQLGLKNTGLGNARVSDVHGNFIVNDGGATAAEVLALIDLIKQKALTERGVELETEVQIIGQSTPI